MSIQLLPPEVSRRIAAGEVIEKPASVVRELLDNALDAGSNEIDITWEEGGSESIRVRDNGCGMTREDLELCWQPHATSKIRTVEDLDHTRTLGFRGEALASIAAVSELTVESTAEGADYGHRLDVRHARLLSVSPAPPRPGTSVTVQRLFANLPARRRFLSRAQAESKSIRNTILEKILPYPAVRITMPGTGGSKRVLPAQTLVERTAQVYGPSCPAQSLTELHGTGDGFSCTILAAHPEVVRRDRRLISIYVNGRRITEYKLVQAVEYAYQDVQHGGVFPAAAVLIEVNPELADFNIHPAKREVRLRTMNEIHHRIVTILRTHLHGYAVRAARLATPWEQSSGELWERPSREPSSPGAAPRTAPGPSAAPGPARGPFAAKAPFKAPSPARPFQHQRRAVPESDGPEPDPDPAPEATGIRFLGTVFGTYNIVERGDLLYLIDQHAVHERLLYNRLRADRAPQTLLIPEEFEVTADEDQALREHQEEYRHLGIVLERIHSRQWRMTALPGTYQSATGEILETILELRGIQEEFDRRFLAEIACRAALKAGDYLDGITGEELARQALALQEPRCPHGRPLWVELSRAQLDTLIGRR